MTRGNDTGKSLKKTDARSARLAEALRANLRQRKAQQRRAEERRRGGAASDAAQSMQNDKNR